MMFYTHLFTSTRGPLAKIWLAAHWERKITKAQVFECNLEVVVEDIISPKVKIGLRTSGHLLVGVVRIYSRKAKYLLADCSDALIKVKTAFRPGQTDLTVEEFEAERKAITLIEDFTAFDDFAVFDDQLPDLSDIDVVDHFSLNQSRTEEITLKENFENKFMTLIDYGDESQISYSGLLDMSMHSLSHHGDAFGDEDNGVDLLDFLINSSDDADESTDFIADEPRGKSLMTPTLNYSKGSQHAQMDTPALSETTLLSVEEMGFALEPVPITPNSEKKRGKRKRKLIVDQNKELSDAAIREQISDFSDLVATMDLAPPTLQLMLWKESGGAHRLFVQPCTSIVAPQMIELFSIFGKFGARSEVEVIRQDRREARGDTSVLTTEDIDIADLSVGPDPTPVPPENSSSIAQDESRSAPPELLSENSALALPPLEEEICVSSLNTRLAEESQVIEDGNMSRRAQQLLDSLRSNSDGAFSLSSLCEGATRSKAATTFFCLLVLGKQQSLRLQQDAAYGDILVTPGATT